MEEAALVSGARYWQVMPKITLPLLRPAILSTVLLLFMLGMSSYEVPRLIGRPARIDVFTTDIQAATQSAPPEFGMASALSITLLVDLHRRCVLLPARDAQRRSLRHHHRQGLHADAHRVAALALAGVRSASALMFVVSLGLPLLTLVWQSFYRNLAQPFVGSTGAGDAGELRVHPALSDLPRRGEDERAARRHGGDRDRRAHVRHGLDRAARGCRAPAGCSIRSRSRRSRFRT